MTNDNGYIKLPRSLFNSKEWKTERTFTLIEAYIDLQLMAYYGTAPTTRVVNYKKVTLNNGQLATTRNFLAQRWGWASSRVRRELMKLAEQGYIQLVGQSSYSVITVNQPFNITPTPRTEQPTEQPTEHNNIKIENKNNITTPKKENDVKEKQQLQQQRRRRTKSTTTTAAFVAPTADEVARYCAEQGLTWVDAAVFVDYYESKGWRVGSSPMRSWQCAARNWQRREANRRGPSPTPLFNNTTMYNNQNYTTTTGAPAARLSHPITNQQNISIVNHENNGTIIGRDALALQQSNQSTNATTTTLGGGGGGGDLVFPPLPSEQAVLRSCPGPRTAAANFGAGAKAAACHQALEGFAARQAGYIAGMDAQEPDF